MQGFVRRSLSSNVRDVVIVGGGVIGSATGYFLAKRSPGIKITVYERDPTYATCSTSLSAGGLRTHFSTPECVAMSQFGLDFVRDVANQLTVDADMPPSVDLHEDGYLFLASDATLNDLKWKFGVQQSMGAKSEFLEIGELQKRFPWLNTEGVVAGVHGVGGEGWLDPYSLLMAFRAKAISLGVQYQSSDVLSLEREGDHVTGVRVRSKSGGETVVPCGTVVNAAGPYAGYLSSTAGIDLPVRPRRRYVFSFRANNPPVPTPGAPVPLLVDTTGCYFRPEASGTYICGVSPHPDCDPDATSNDPQDVDYSVFENQLWLALAHRVPAFEEIRLERGWAGLYDYNTFDQNAILGPHPHVKNLIFANGFSGHGLQHAPATGRAVSELILDGRYTTLDLNVFGYNRIVENQPLVEKCVV